ncbi:long-chain fatty acid--CoA ligase [Baekduia soli]|uniref:Long-chain fatty acid--CoA ligase n=1 Tax=Baekduia soli TaxID=496014 RepID=A0A5B8UBX3_9ACTN|nr:AMP-binding protein [Baekduia soli]QEC50328.1 long-chain fatty acid--CoA ligase [Baekduia soli]
MLARNRIEYLETYLACALRGAAVQALNWRLSPQELATILNASPPRAILVDPEFAGEVQALQRDVACEHWVAWDAEGGPSPFEDLVAAGAGADESRLGRAGGTDPFIVVYTGGSTGVSKGAVHTHATALGAMANNTVGEGVTPDDRFLLMGQMFHSPVVLAINYLTHGCPVVMANFEAGLVLRAIEDEAVTATMGIPTMFQNMLAVLAGGGPSMASLRHVQYGGSPTAESVTRELLEALGCDLLQCYGRTEELAITFLSPQDHVDAVNGRNAHRLQSCGREAWLTRVELLDADDRVIPRSSDEPGEVIAKSPATMVGYLGRPDLTAEATFGDGWLRTGDVGRFDADGYLYIVGRAKDMIISGGENIYPAQVELAIQRHAAVLEAAVVGVPDPLWGESVMAYVVLKPGVEAVAADIAAAVATHLGSYQKPKYVEFLAELPKTSAGKIAKPVLKQMALDAHPG